jgi:hypothetical protein
MVTSPTLTQMGTDMNQEKQRLEDCDLGDYVKCSNAIEVECNGNYLLFPASAHPFRDLNTWKFERRLMSRIVAVPPPPCSGWPPDDLVKVETLAIWVRVN